MFDFFRAHRPSAQLAALILTGFLGVAGYAVEPRFSFSHLAGTTGGGGKADGTGTAARFRGPTGLAVDRAGNLYVADTGNHTIRKCSPDGNVVTLAGRAGERGRANGSGSAARFDSPMYIAVDSGGNVLVADEFSIRKVSPSGLVSTLAGGSPGTRDGVGSDAQFQGPSDLAIDSADNLYCFDGDRIRKISPGGTVTTLPLTDTSGQPITLRRPNALAVDNSGTLLAADISQTLTSPRLFRVTPAGVATRFTGLDQIVSGTIGAAAGDPAGNIFLTTPFSGGTVHKILPNNSATIVSQNLYATWGLAIDSAGRVYVSLATQHRIVRISPLGEVEPFVGLAPEVGQVDGAGVTARFDGPHGLSADTAGNLFVIDREAQNVRRIAPDGWVTTLFTTSAPTASGEPPIAYFAGAVSDRVGGFWLLDNRHNTVRRNLDGTIRIVAGSPGNSGSIDGTGPAARFRNLSGAAVDGAGNLYVLESSCIRKVTPDAVVTTIAGSTNATGSADGAGETARFFQPAGIALHESGTLYVADTLNHTIRRVSPEGVVTTVAGAPEQRGHVDARGAAARFESPIGIAVDRANNLYVACGDHTIRFVAADGVVSTIGGAPGVTGADDGGRDEVRFTSPNSIVLDAAGNLLLADANHAIRKGTRLGLASAPVITTQPENRNVQMGGSVTFSVSALSDLPANYQWQFNGSPIAGATQSSLSISAVRTADAGDYTVVVTNDLGSVTSNKATLTVTAPPPPSPPPSGGGGGAPSVWFGLAMLALVWLRGRRPAFSE